MNLKETTFSIITLSIFSQPSSDQSKTTPPPIAADGGEPVAVDPWMQEGDF